MGFVEVTAKSWSVPGPVSVSFPFPFPLFLGLSGSGSSSEEVSGRHLRNLLRLFGSGISSSELIEIALLLELGTACLCSSIFSELETTGFICGAGLASVFGGVVGLCNEGERFPRGIILAKETARVASGTGLVAAIAGREPPIRDLSSGAGTAGATAFGGGVALCGRGEWLCGGGEGFSTGILLAEKEPASGGTGT